jgi:hypothetical protein
LASVKSAVIDIIWNNLWPSWKKLWFLWLLWNASWCFKRYEASGVIHKDLYVFFLIFCKIFGYRRIILTLCVAFFVDIIEFLYFNRPIVLSFFSIAVILDSFYAFAYKQNKNRFHLTMVRPIVLKLCYTSLF